MSSSYYSTHKSKRNKYIKTPQHSIHQLCSYTYIKFNNKYKVSMFKYGSTVINNIIYNEKSHIVALFKDYLILDDTSEFLKRYYTKYESDVRLPRFFEYYETYSKIYPNYTALLEGKFIYRNIQRKQRMIDLQEQMEMENKKNKKMNNKFHMKDASHEVFSTDVYDSIINDRNNEDIEMLFDIKIEHANEEDEMFHRNVEKIINDINININEHENVSQCSNKGVMHVDKNLIKKIEKNLIKSKTKTNNNNNNNSSNGINNISIYGYSCNYTNNIKTKISDLKLLYQKNIHHSYIRANNDNSSSIIHAHMSYKGNNSIISNENIPIPKSPLTDRIIHNNNNNNGNNHSSVINNKTHQKNMHSNNIIVNTNNHQHKDKGSSSGSKHTTQQPNNVIYIINQNPKFTTHVNVYNTNNAKHRKHISSSSSSNTTRQISASSSMKRILHSAKPHSNPKHIKHISNSSSIQSSTSHTIHPYQHHSSTSNIITSALPKRNNITSKSKYSTLNSTAKVKKRNVSNNNNFINNSGSNYYCNMLKTAREIGYKELNMLKSTSNYNKHNSITKYSNLPSKRTSIQQNSVNTVISRNTSGVVSTKAKNTNNNNNNNNEINSRNKRNCSNDNNNNNNNNNKNSSNSSIKHNIISKNDSLTKYGFIDVVNVKKKIVKGIHINNFSKIFNMNVSQFNNNNNKTERTSKQK